MGLLTFRPSGVFDASGALGGSTIQRPSKSLCEKLWREVSRPLYRAQVPFSPSVCARRPPSGA